MSDLRNCSLCNSLFIYFGTNDICPQCSNNSQSEFSVVREYLYDNPGSNASDVARATGVDEAVILRFLREGRLSIRS